MTTVTLDQLPLDAGLAEQILNACKYNCGRKVVGSSITGDGKVCKHCNETEWGEALAASPEPYYRKLGALPKLDGAGEGEAQDG